MLEDLIRQLRDRNYSNAQIIDTCGDEGYEECEILAALARLPRPQAQRHSAAVQSSGRKAASGPPRDCRKDLMRAPYRFVELNDRVATVEAPTPHDRPIPEGCCATITVRWVAETPLLIGDEKDDITGPLRLWDDPTAPFAVPGSSLRGMLRSAMEIVAFGRLSRLNAHHRYGLRDFEHPSYRNGDFPLSQVDEVRAGWLSRSGDGYAITPCQWAQVEIADLVGRDRAFEWTVTGLENKYRQFQMGGFDFSRRRKFVRAEDRNNKILLRPDPRGSIDGVLVFADKVPSANRGAWENSGKKVEYVFYGDEGAPIDLTPEAMAQFRRANSKPSRNKSEPTGSWKKLEKVVERGQRIPVFYVGEPNAEKFAFGLTRLFKVPHKYRVGELLARSGQQKDRPSADAQGVERGIDFVENLFGYVLEDEDFAFDGSQANKPNALARKGRVAFSFGLIEADCAIEQEDVVETVMMGPRASFAPFYLVGKGHKDYSDKDARLAGRKRYLPRYPGGTDSRQLANSLHAPSENTEIRTRLKFLLPAPDTELAFSSTIRLHNVSEVELGAVLWTLTHGGAPSRYRHMLGRAKAFGAGQLRVDQITLSIVPNDPAHPPTAAADITHFLEAFEEAMVRAVGPGWRNSPQITQFLATSDPERGKTLADLGELSYLSELRDFAALRKTTKMLATEEAPCRQETFLSIKIGE
ncbi:MAG TPA: TIGR03986 family CRISPR-associated RAMP protein [Magnetospirillum sp.]|nr:TIGR03986 family CRISPR-associated RAMP protein [Magnetospirillum sp.]